MACRVERNVPERSEGRILDVLLRRLAGHHRLPLETRAMIAGPQEAPLLLVLGGISGNASVARLEGGTPGWWASLFGEGALLGTQRFRILGIDFVADESGAYAPDTFEQASIIADTLEEIGEEPLAIIGASYGGMVALAYAQRFDARTPLVIVSASARPHPMATAQRSLQRKVVALGLWQGCADRALAIARGMAMLTYRTAPEFAERFEGGICSPDPLSASQPMDYLEARGRAYVEAMSPGRFLSLSASIDRHRVDPRQIRSPALVIGVDEDQLVPIGDVAALAAGLAGETRLRTIGSIYGHDAFLKEPELLGRLVDEFLAECGGRLAEPLAETGT